MQLRKRHWLYTASRAWWQVPLVIIGLTGSLLVFSEELEHFLNPPTTGCSRWAGIPTACGGCCPQFIQTSCRTGLQFLKRRSRFIRWWWCHPRMNIPMFMLILRRSFSCPWNKLGGFLIESHVHLYLQVIWGCKLSEGLLLLLISVTGLILWTGWRRLLRQNCWKSPWQLVNYDLH